mmetsp:Transcript_45664/g.40902  ORF Transcript_45664/g.40902 Transcript_45664/m.40902 type:complete len:149 (-) Transcript_45664:162-608(-)
MQRQRGNNGRQKLKARKIANTIHNKNVRRKRKKNKSKVSSSPHLNRNRPHLNRNPIPTQSIQSHTNPRQPNVTQLLQNPIVHQLLHSQKALFQSEMQKLLKGYDQFLLQRFTVQPREAMNVDGEDDEKMSESNNESTKTIHLHINIPK